MNNLKDTIIYVVLAFILVVTSLTLFLQTRESFLGKETVPYLPSETPATPEVSPKVDKLISENNNLSRQLVGAVVMLAEDGSYLRLSVKDEGVFSVGITDDLLITNMSDEVITLKDIDPFAEATLEVISLEDTQRYDFLAVWIKIKTSSDLTIDERSQRTLERVKRLDN